MPARFPESCPHRQTDDAAAKIDCTLLGELLAGLSPEVSRVSHDTCLACCRSFLPTTIDLNPVLASLIWSRTQIALGDPDLPIDAEFKDRLVALQQLAEENLPLLTTDEDDLPLSPAEYPEGDRLSVVDLTNHLPLPIQSGAPIRKWAVGVTTAPRRQPTLAESTASLMGAGWDSIHLFVDGEVDVPASLREYPRTVHLPAAGAWKNFYLALVELLRRTDADGIMILQDDALWPTHLPVKIYLEQISWPEDGRFIISPYCCSEYTADSIGWRRFESEWHFGAVAFIFSRRSAEQFIADSRVINYGLTQTAAIDSIVGEWAARNQIPVFVPTPSLVQHFGDISTLWKTSRAVGFRRASRFIGDELPPS